MRYRHAVLAPEYIMENWWPGSRDYESWGNAIDDAWEAEYGDINSRPHFARLVEWMRNEYRPDSWTAMGPDPITLGDDDRVWDGHHRILAAYVLGWRLVPISFGGPGSWWEVHLES